MGTNNNICKQMTFGMHKHILVKPCRATDMLRISALFLSVGVCVLGNSYNIGISGVYCALMSAGVNGHKSEQVNMVKIKYLGLS